MAKVGFIHHDIFLKHETGLSHPENHLRLASIYDHVKGFSSGNRLVEIEAVSCDESLLELIHSAEYIEYVRKICRENESAVLDDGDTRVCKDSYLAAIHAVGAAIQAVKLVDSGKLDRAFVAARPPGHHALHNHAMGFCLFNNIAIAAKYAQLKLGYRRIMILDWDVHHGNGTQDAFYEDETVLVCNLHEYPFYPGSGSVEERGAGKGLNYTINIPVPAGAEIDYYREGIKNQIIPAAVAFRPELLLISAGFDGHAQDHMANGNLRDEDYYELTKLSLSIADRFCKGRVVSLLEGGYNKDSLARSVMQHLLALADSEDE